MRQEYPVSVLAAYATIKSLQQEKKYGNAYQLLSEFIRHIIVEKALRFYSAGEMKHYLFEFFGFTIPEAVVKTASRGMQATTLENGIFAVDKELLGSDSYFLTIQEKSGLKSNTIIEALSEYVSKKQGQNADRNKLTQGLIEYLINDQQSVNTEYADIISEFIILNENNQDVTEGLSSIRQGSILILGLNHNISETGSITKPLTLYLGTEILFSLVGYNGEIYKELAKDFFDLVRAANSNGREVIMLRYFKDIKDEIDDFFAAAEKIVEGKKAYPIWKVAMKAITTGCSDPSDVITKKSDFEHDIRYGFGIRKDSENNYYDEELYDCNLEDFAFLEESEKTSKKEVALKLVSNINKLRKGVRFHNILDSEHLIVTNTKVINAVSKDQVERIKVEEGIETIADFAVSLDRITSLLWYKLGRGFGENSYPVSVNAALQARRVLSASIAKKVERVYFESKEQYDQGIITEGKLADRLIALKGKAVKPEDIIGDDIEEIMDFSQEYFSRAEAEMESKDKTIKEQKDIIKTMQDSAEAEKVATKAILHRKDEELAAEKEEKKRLQEEVNRYHEKENAKREKKETWKRIAQFCGAVLWKLFAVAVIVYLSTWICGLLSESEKSTVGVIAGLLGTIIALVAVLKNDVKKYLKR